MAHGRRGEPIPTARSHFDHWEVLEGAASISPQESQRFRFRKGQHGVHDPGRAGKIVLEIVSVTRGSHLMLLFAKGIIGKLNL